jgi:hypothetical protein
MVQSEDRMRKPLLIQKQKRICKEYQDYEKDSMFIKLEQEKKRFQRKQDNIMAKSSCGVVE